MKNRNEHIFILAALYFIFESRFFCILNVIFIYIFFVFILLLMFVLNVTILLIFFAWNYISFRGNTLSMEQKKSLKLFHGLWYIFLLYSFAISVPFFRELNKWRQNDGISCSNKQYILINITKTITFVFAWCDGKKKRIMKS